MAMLSTRVFSRSLAGLSCRHVSPPIRQIIRPSNQPFSTSPPISRISAFNSRFNRKDTLKSKPETPESLASQCWRDVSRDYKLGKGKMSIVKKIFNYHSKARKHDKLYLATQPLIAMFAMHLLISIYPEEKKGMARYPPYWIIGLLVVNRMPIVGVGLLFASYYFRDDPRHVPSQMYRGLA